MATDLAVFGARTRTMDPQHPFATAIAVQNGTVVAVDCGARCAHERMKPMVRGKETDLVEISTNWYLDGLPPMILMKTSPNSHRFVNPRDIEQMWCDQFDWVYREMDYVEQPEDQLAYEGGFA